MGTSEIIVLVARLLGIVAEDLSQWIQGGESVLDYAALSARLGGPFASELLLQREKARLAKPTT